MKEEEHAHKWGAWNYAGYSTEMRTCTCGTCTGAEYRQHHHNWVKQPDVFAPMGSGLTVKVCSGATGCGDTQRG